MDTISVGVLHTNSGILPMSKLFDRGMRQVFKDQSDIDIEINPEFVGQGSYRQVEEAVSKMLNFHDVDVITGIVSSKVVMELADKFKERDVLFLPNNLGEQILDPAKAQKNIYLNSPLLWQQIWSLGNWATKEFGSRAMFAGGVYDMAYCFSHVLDLGMRAADPDCHWSFAVSHMPAEGQTLSDPSVVYEFIEREMPDFLFAAFCGKEASLFLDGFIERGFHKKVPLVTTPYLLEDFSAAVTEPLTLYTTLGAGKEVTGTDLDQDWTSVRGGFSAMGRDSARIILEAFQADNRDEFLKQPYQSERGSVYLDPTRSGIDNQVSIVKNLHPGAKSQIERSIVAGVETVNITNELIIEGFEETETSWFNPYLGV